MSCQHCVIVYLCWWEKMHFEFIANSCGRITKLVLRVLGQCHVLSSKELKWKWSRQSCSTIYDPMDCNLQGSFIHGIVQERVLERIVISFSREAKNWMPLKNLEYSCFTIFCQFLLSSKVNWPYIHISPRTRLDILEKDYGKDNSSHIIIWNNTENGYI